MAWAPDSEGSATVASGDPPSEGRAKWRYIGPGIVAAATGVGAGLLELSEALESRLAPLGATAFLVGFAATSSRYRADR